MKIRETIIYLHPHFTIPGGAGKVALETAQRLNAMGYNVVMLCGQVEKDCIKKYYGINFKSINCPLSSSFLFWLFYPIWQRRINKVINQYDKKILFPQIFPANWWAFIYKKYHPWIRCIWYCHEPSAFIHIGNWIKSIHNPIKKFIAIILNPILKFFDLHLSNYCDIIIANSLYSAGVIKSIYKKEADKIIYPGVDIELNNQFDSGMKEDYIFAVSRLTKFKKIDLLLNAFSLINNKNIELKIAGEGEEMNNLIALAKKLNIHKRTIFLGRLSDTQLKNYYKKAKLLVFCSKDEPFGIVPVEAMANGTPVIASRSGGPKEIIKDYQTGLLFEPDNILDLKNKIGYLLADQRYLEFGKLAEIYAKKKFTWDKVVDQIIPLLNKLSN